jgi:peptidoglycan biosynthesis protein MviN/MurJ (putative lipid II flippase)
MIGAIYEGGSFNAYDTAQTALALNGFAFGLVGYAAMKVLTPAFYALQDSRTPMVISLLSVGVNFFTATTLIRLVGLGHEGLAMTTSAVAVFGFLALLGPGKLSYLAALAAAIPGGAAVYWAVCRMLDVPELEPVTRSLDRFNPWRRATISTR